MSANIFLNGLSREEFQEDMIKAFSEALGREINPASFGGCINGEEFSFTSKKQNKPSRPSQQNEQYLTRRQVVLLLQISLPTLHRYTKDGVLKSYRIGGKVRYKKQEVEEALKERNFGLPKKGGFNG